MVDEASEKVYNSFMINRALSQFPDTVMIANEMNITRLPSDMQYQFHLNIIGKRKRYSKWPKSAKIDNLQIVQDYYGYSVDKAKYALGLLTPAQIEKIQKSVDQGGRTKRYK